MAVEITMPKLSDTMEEGKIIRWLVKEGDRVAGGDVIAEIETDKADMEFETIDDGVILKILLQEGESAPVGKPIAMLGEEGEATPAEDKAAPKKPPKAEKKRPTEHKDKKPLKKEEVGKGRPKKAEPAEKKPSPQEQAVEAFKASPIARRLADEAGVDITEISGSGPEGRVVKRDVEAYLEGTSPKGKPEPPMPRAVPERIADKTAPLEKPLAGKRVPMSLMRKTVAKRMTESKTTVPHFYLMVEVDMGPVMDARELIAQQEGVKLSINDFIIKAAAKALMEYPRVNAHLEGNEIVHHETADIGVAVALEDGLITPVVRNCQDKGLVRISTEVKNLAERAKNRKLTPEEYTGAGFTVSNLGMYGIDLFAAIINPPESCILAVGQVAEVPVAEGGLIKIGKRMKITLSCDHRVVDGSVGAEFLATLKEILEHPMRMLI